MKQVIFSLLQICICTMGCLYTTSKITLAQVTSDGTVNTQVNQNGNVAEITGGETRGSNLFHSFQDFSVRTGNEAFFDNANDISNIFSRVTGGNISNIDGAIRANGSASLFLINPAGIIFGENASLDIGGSFYGSGASSILFEDGEFSATDLDNPPVLTINAPIGLNLRDNPGNVVNRSVSNNLGLRVNSGETISFTGSEVRLDGGKATAPGGKVEVLGNKVSLINNAAIDVSGETGGGTALIGGDYQGRNSLVNATRTYIDDTVTINADAFSNGNGGRVIVWGDEVTGFYGNISARGGDISGNGGFVEVSGKEHLVFRGNVDTTAVNGFTGTLLLDPTNIIIANGSGDSAADGENTFAGNNSSQAGSILSTPLSEIDDTAPTTIFETELEGLSGDTNVILQATNDITIQDLADDELTFAAGSGVIAFTADADADGAGDFVMEDNIADTIKTNGRSVAISGASLTIGNVNTVNSGEIIDNVEEIPDNAGETTASAFIVANDSGVNVESITGNISEAGDADTYQIFVTGNGTFSASTINGSDIDTQLFLFDSGGLGIYSNDDVSTSEGLQSTLPAGNPLTPNLPGIYFLAVSEFGVNPVSEGGNIFSLGGFGDVNTPNGEGGTLPLSGFSSEEFSTSTGNYTINLTGVEGTQTTFEESTPIVTSGSITLNATNGDINLGGTLNSSGDSLAGDITVNADNGAFNSSGGSINTSTFLEGNAGNIDINAGTISISNSFISTNAEIGNAGNISIQADSTIQITNTAIDPAAFGDGRTGNITIESLNRESIDLISNSEFSSTIFTDSFGNIEGVKTGGDLRIIGGQITIDGYELNTGVNGLGNGGDIFITGNSVNIKNSSSILTDTLGSGDAGSINIDIDNNGAFNLSNSSITTRTNSQGNAGNIDVDAGSISISEGGTIVADVGEEFVPTDDTVIQPGNIQAGSVDLNATGDITISGDASRVSASTEGRGLGGNINITTPNSLTIRDGAALNLNSGGLATGGNLVINSGSLALENNGRILAQTSSGRGGLLDINVDNTLSMRENSEISARAGGAGDGGNIEIDAGFVIAYPNLNEGNGNDIVTAANESGTGGNINITTEALLGFDNRLSVPGNNTNNIDVSSQFGLSGDFTLTILNVDLTESITQLPNNVVEPKQTVAQVCQADRESIAQNTLTIEGRGGISAEPGLPLDSQIISIDGKTDDTSAIPEPIETSLGKIQPARGVKVTESGKVILTAYRTDNLGERIPQGKVNCITSSD